MNEPFGFEIEEVTTSIYDDDGKWVGEKPTGMYRISLPHQCDAWEIVGDYTGGLPKDEAIAELERFIKEAQETLAKLQVSS